MKVAELNCIPATPPYSLTNSLTVPTRRYIQTRTQIMHRQLFNSTLTVTHSSSPLLNDVECIDRSFYANRSLTCLALATLSSDGLGHPTRTAFYFLDRHRMSNVPATSNSLVPGCQPTDTLNTLSTVALRATTKIHLSRTLAHEKCFFPQTR